MKSHMWSVVNKKTRKIVKVKVGFEHNRHGPGRPRNSYVMGFSSKQAVIDEYGHPDPKKEKIEKIIIEY